MSEMLPDVLQILFALAAAAAVTALALAAYQGYLLIYQRYLAQLSGEGGLVAAGAGGGTLSALRGTVIAFLAVVNERWLPSIWLERIELASRKAGRPLELKPAEIFALAELGALVSLSAGIFLSLLLGLSWASSILFLLLGALYPFVWLRDKVRARHHAITRALPYDLDLLTLSVEAGLDFAAALGKVVEKGRKGPLADELSITLKELKLGKTREEALRNLAVRVDLPTLTSFVQALLQADKMGTPLGKILRILSTQMRVDRTQRAEKLANEAPVKLLFPLIFFIFPTVFLIIFAPISYQVFLGGNF